MEVGKALSGLLHTGGISHSKACDENENSRTKPLEDRYRFHFLPEGMHRELKGNQGGQTSEEKDRNVREFSLLSPDGRWGHRTASRGHGRERCQKRSKTE